jgi:hypothetical protein
MSSFSNEISGNRMPRGELSEAQRIYCLAQVEAGVRTSKIADALKCSQRCVQKTVARWKATSSNTSRPRAGRPPTLTSRDHRQLLRITRENPHIEYKRSYRRQGCRTPTLPAHKSHVILCNERWLIRVTASSELSVDQRSVPLQQDSV